MALNIPTWKNPYDPLIPYENAYGWMRLFVLNLLAGQGRGELAIHPRESAWQAQPVDTLSVSQGEVLVPGDPTADPPVPEVRFPTHEEMMEDLEYAHAIDTVGRKWYERMAALHPALAGSVVV